MASTSSPADTNMDTLVNIKIAIDGIHKRFKLPLRDLGAATLTEKLCANLGIPSTTQVVFERFSDSAGAFVVLDSENAAVYKQLYRAAKAKLKLRLRATVSTPEVNQSPAVDVKAEPTIDISQPAAPAAAEAAMNDLTPAMNIFAKCPLRLKKEISSETAKTFGVEKERDEVRDVKSTSESRNGHYSSCEAELFSVYCNECEEPIPNEHFHCSQCDDGDFDLCMACVDKGVSCDGIAEDRHWMIKRFIQDGEVKCSSTMRLLKMDLPVPPVPIFPSEESTTETRSCNCCRQEFILDDLVTCDECSDYDLCVECFGENDHGHDLSHSFWQSAGRSLPEYLEAMLASGRDADHHAICDGCDNAIRGVREKCLTCPDWDFCSDCAGTAHVTHPGHRFVTIYEPLGDHELIVARQLKLARHVGVLCDGPLCNKGPHGVQTHIRGDRYKCTICSDYDLCAACEAHPDNKHNRTHPLLKMKTPIRHVSITTMEDECKPVAARQMSDVRGRTVSKATSTTASPSINAATQVRTVAEIMPVVKIEDSNAKEKLDEWEATTSASKTQSVFKETPLLATFLRDTVQDGTTISSDTPFEQTWTLRNTSSTLSWPVGCFLSFAGGDHMSTIDPNRLKSDVEHPITTDELRASYRSNATPKEIAPGQEYSFSLLMRTPTRSGKAISYFRLTTADGQRFGHRLWCDVNVVPVANTEVVGAAHSVSEELASQIASSQLSFPILDKESPVASMHDGAVVSDVATNTSEASNDMYGDDDFETGDDFGDEKTESGFMTDEEWDVLDASDEEALAEQAVKSQK